MIDTREVWSAARDSLKTTLRPLLEAEGLRPRAAIHSLYDFVGEGCDVELTKKGRYGWDTLVVKVKPSRRVGSRPSIFYQKVGEITPEARDVLVQKVVTKAREFREAEARIEARDAERKTAAASAEKRIGEFMRIHFPEFRPIYGATFEDKSRDVTVRLEARVEGEDVTFKMRIDEYVSAGEARATVDFFARLEAARM